MKCDEVEAGMKVRTNVELSSTRGVIIHAHAESLLNRRECGVGVVVGVVGGHGGDVWWVRHDDGMFAPYCFDEFEEVPMQTTTPEACAALVSLVTEALPEKHRQPYVDWACKPDNRVEDAVEVLEAMGTMPREIVQAFFDSIGDVDDLTTSQALECMREIKKGLEEGAASEECQLVRESGALFTGNRKERRKQAAIARRRARQ